jgi:hypothetical protein
MRLILPLICFLLSISSISQDLIVGFYQVSAHKNVFALKDEDSDKLLYLQPQPILILEDVDRIWIGRMASDITHSITFKLNEKGTKKMKAFSQNATSVRLALVVEDKILQTANLNTGITGLFSINGFEKMEAKELRKKLNKAQLDNRGNHYLYVNQDFIIYKDRAVFKEAELYNSKTDVDDFIERETKLNTKCAPKYTSYYNPLSLIGNFYSYEFGGRAETMCIRQGSGVSVKTIDIVTGEEVSMLTLFEEKDIVNEFKKDSWVVESSERNKIDIEEIKDFNGVLNFAKDKLSANMQYSPSSFCVVDFKNGIAKVKFVGKGYVGGNSYWHAPISFELPVKKKALHFFEHESNFYLGAFKNGVTDIVNN